MTAETVKLPGSPEPLAIVESLSRRAAGSALLRLGPFLVMFYAACLPQELRIELSGLSIYPYRMAAIALLPWLVQQLWRGRLRVHWADALVMGSALWMIISFIAFYGAADGLIRGGALVLDVVPPYLVARLCIVSLTDIRRVLVFVAPGIALVGASMMLEALLQQQVIRPLFAQAFGSLSRWENGLAVGAAQEFVDYRLGLLRAAGPFPHPILAGLFLASLLPLYLLSGLRRWPPALGTAAALCAIFSVSSAVILALALFLALAAYDRLQRRVTLLSWSRALAATGVVLLLLQVISQNGLVAVAIRLTLNPATGYYRRLTWEYGMRSVAQHPWLGIAYTDYDRALWMHNSIDSHWLLLAVRHGFLPPLLLLIACAYAVIRLSSRSIRAAELERRLCAAIAMSLAVMVLAGFTVAFFGGMQTWFLMLLGLALSIASAAPRRPINA